MVIKSTSIYSPPIRFSFSLEISEASEKLHSKGTPIVLNSLRWDIHPCIALMPPANAAFSYRCGLSLHRLLSVLIAVDWILYPCDANSVCRIRTRAEISPCDSRCGSVVGSFEREQKILMNEAKCSEFAESKQTINISRISSEHISNFTSAFNLANYPMIFATFSKIESSLSRACSARTASLCSREPKAHRR